jgi:hypothetical protein
MNEPLPYWPLVPTRTTARAAAWIAAGADVMSLKYGSAVADDEPDPVEHASAAPRTSGTAWTRRQRELLAMATMVHPV